MGSVAVLEGAQYWESGEGRIWEPRFLDLQELWVRCLEATRSSLCFVQGRAFRLSPIVTKLFQAPGSFFGSAWGCALPGVRPAPRHLEGLGMPTYRSWLARSHHRWCPFPGSIAKGSSSKTGCKLCLPTFRELFHLPTSRANLSRVISPANFSCQLFDKYFTCQLLMLTFCEFLRLTSFSRVTSPASICLYASGPLVV